MVTAPGYGRRNLAVVILGVSLIAAGGSPAAPLSARDIQRIEFLTAERALQRGQMGKFRRLLVSLQSYPLHPYLLYAEIVSRPTALRIGAIDRFLRTYPGTPLATRLRIRELKNLARSRRWTAYLTAYRDTRDVSLRCMRLRALLETGQTEAAYAGVDELWLVPHSQPEACDPVFGAWRKAGRMTEALVWKRIRLAMYAGESGLAGHLARFLGAADRRRVDLWRRVRRQPSLVASRTRFAGADPLIEEILVYGLGRMASRDPERAGRTWETLRSRRAFSPAGRAKARALIGLALARRHGVGAFAWLREVPAAFSSPMVDEWRILSAFRGGNWSEGLAFVERLDPAARDTERWRYWRARALAATGRDAEARRLYLALAGERDYYGFLAADRLGLRYQLHDRPLEFRPAELGGLKQRASFERARELYALGRMVAFRREWNYLTRGMSKLDLARVAKLAQQQGWHGPAILTLGRTQWLDDLGLRFPLAYRERIVAQAAAERIDPAWVFAILRQESAFISDARSPKGALGLMQIMPGTGRRIGRWLNIPLTDNRQLLDTETSIRFGSRYLRSLLDRLFSHPILATAAYNAGPRRVRSWLPEGDEMPADLWVETVPFRETRRYLRRVLASTAIYERRLGEDSVPLSDRFRPIPGRGTAAPTARAAIEAGVAAAEQTHL